ncbi:MAG: hypothetical protein QOI21_857 [Actinomycetota bacterium]|jgi:hypothetical protein|nr:hypothetical protein [Actinomycetota bacterium]
MSEPTPTAEQIVASPANAGDLEKEMKQVAQPFGKLTLWLGAIVVLAVAFGGGVWTHAAVAGTSTAAPARAGGQPAQATGQAGAGRQQGAGGAAGRGTTGTIDRVEGSTVYVKTQQGTEVAVTTSDTTTVSVATPGAVADLKPGATVVVQGATGTDGKVTAQAITQSAPPAG